MLKYDAQEPKYISLSTEHDANWLAINSPHNWISPIVASFNGMNERGAPEIKLKLSIVASVIEPIYNSFFSL